MKAPGVVTRSGFGRRPSSAFLEHFLRIPTVSFRWCRSPKDPADGVRGGVVAGPAGGGCGRAGPAAAAPAARADGRELRVGREPRRRSAPAEAGHGAGDKRRLAVREPHPLLSNARPSWPPPLTARPFGVLLRQFKTCLLHHCANSWLLLILLLANRIRMPPVNRRLSGNPSSR